ncbi:DUF6289 family protein [Longispora urticae]
MIRRTVIAGLIAATATLTLVAPASPAQARACRYDHFCTTIWYSDASRTVRVGSMYEECDGSVYISGTRTSYMTFRESPC